MSDCCAICTDPFQKTRKAVGCPRCPHVACSRCVKTYLLNNTVEPQCMSCKAPWDMDFVRRNLSKSFLDTGYKKHQISTLLSRAEASLGNLQRFVPIKTRLLEIQQEVRALQLEAKSTERNKRLRILQQEKGTLEREWASPTSMTTVATPATATFFMACPRKDCRGRVSTEYQCGLCERRFCRDCHSEDNDAHECSKEDKETVRMLKENTKHCPECHEGIFKEYGCDQMWCTRCHTCFSWKTGKKEHGPIHNPHFFEHMFQQNDGGQVLQQQHGFPRYARLAEKWGRHFLRETRDFLNNMHRLVNHVRFEDLPRLQETIRNHETSEHKKWGVEYLRHKVTREVWGQKLYVAHRKTQRMQEMFEILQTVTIVTCELYQRWFYSEIQDVEFLVSLRTLLVESNNNIGEHNKRFGTKAPFVDPSRLIMQHILDF
jgi:hypothetical protein